MNRRERRKAKKKKSTKARAPRRKKGHPMARGQLTKTQYRALLERLGGLVGENVRQVVPERSVITASGLPPQAITHDELVHACAATAGAVVGTMLDVFGVLVVDDPPAEPTKPKLVT